MDIGNNIERFENSQGTLEDFNTIFKYTKLDAPKTDFKLIEIGRIVSTGKETQRELKLYTGDNKIIETIIHDFYPHFYGQATKMQVLERKKDRTVKNIVAKSKQKYYYRAVDEHGKTIATSKTMKDLDKKLGVSRETVRSRCYNDFSFKQDSKTKKTIKFNVTRVRRK